MQNNSLWRENLSSWLDSLLLLESVSCELQSCHITESDDHIPLIDGVQTKEGVVT